MGEYLHREYEKLKEEKVLISKPMAKHFIVGPVEMFPRTQKTYETGYTYFRTTEYSQITKDCLKKLSQLLGNNEPDSMIYLASSGTGAMEATVINCVTEEDKCLVINSGTFGKRFCELLAHHGKNFDSVNLAWNEKLDSKHLNHYENQGYTMLFVNLHETSTGQLYDIQMLSDFCQRNNMFLIVDAISTFLADEYDMDKYSIDLTIISSQKGLCLSPGMSFVSFSRRMLDKIQKMPQAKVLYLDFKDYLKNIARGQTPYTPPVCIMYELQDQLKHIESIGGIRAWLGMVSTKAIYFRAKLKKHGFKIAEYPLSNLLTPIILEDVNAYEVIQILKDKYGLYVNPCSGDLAKKLIRVSHIGNTTCEDFDNLLEKLILSVNKVKERELVYVK